MRASYGLAAVLVAASLHGRWLLGQELEMTMTGIVTRSDGQALPASRVVAYNLLRDKAFAAKTGPGGTFHLKGLPAGTYIIFAINPDGYVDVGDQGGHTPANKHLRVTLAEGETVSNLTLLADATPPPEEPLPPASLTPPPPSPGPSPPSCTAPQTVQCRPDPPPVLFNNQRLLDFSSSDAFVDNVFLCRDNVTRGCHRYTIAPGLIHGQTRCFQNQLLVVEHRMDSHIDVVRPDSPIYDPPCPTAQRCAQLPTSCPALRAVLQPFSATVAHECGHRAFFQDQLKRIWEAFRDTIERIQARLGSCSNCACANPAIQEEILEAEDLRIARMLALIELTEQEREEPALSAQCAHLRSLCP